MKTLTGMFTNRFSARQKSAGAAVQYTFTVRDTGEELTVRAPQNSPRGDLDMYACSRLAEPVVIEIDGASLLVISIRDGWPVDGATISRNVTTDACRHCDTRPNVPCYIGGECVGHVCQCGQTRIDDMPSVEEMQRRRGIVREALKPAVGTNARIDAALAALLPYTSRTSCADPETQELARRIEQILAGEGR